MVEVAVQNNQHDDWVSKGENKYGPGHYVMFRDVIFHDQENDIAQEDYSRHVSAYETGNLLFKQSGAGEIHHEGADDVDKAEVDEKPTLRTIAMSYFVLFSLKVFQ